MEGENYSLSDIAAVSNGNGFGGNSAWVIILFALLLGGGFGYGNRGGEQYATTADVQRGFNQQDTGAQLRGITYGIADSTYALNNAIMGIGGKITDEGRGIQTGLCEVVRTSDANTQKILDAISTNRIADMQNQINQLQLQNAVCGVVRYPMASTYTSGTNPFCGSGCGCGYNNGI